jgi:DNA/RNA-binding domain of Phe-tRNA-synthetase-like protein
MVGLSGMNLSGNPVGAKLTYVMARMVDLQRLASAVVEVKAAASSRMAEDVEEISRSINSFVSFFAALGFECPLPLQYEKALKRGLPTIFPAVDLLLAVEMGFGILAGIQDLSKVRGGLRFDLVTFDEAFDGMRSKVYCRPGELVIRDQEGIIASFFQGPDKRTKLSPSSTELLAFVFSTPETNANSFEAAADCLRSVLTIASSHVSSFSLSI